MVGRGALLAGLVASLAGPGLAASPWDRMFPDPDSCYRRDYAAAHLASHPAQRVTRISLQASPEIPAYPWPAVTLRVTLRGAGGGDAEAVAYCQNVEDTLYCAMEGDAGGFDVTLAKGGAILISVARDGMGFETATDFVTLEARKGDDRSFLLQPARDCR